MNTTMQIIVILLVFANSLTELVIVIACNGRLSLSSNRTAIPVYILSYISCLSPLICKYSNCVIAIFRSASVACYCNCVCHVNTKFIWVFTLILAMLQLSYSCSNTFLLKSVWSTGNGKHIMKWACMHMCMMSLALFNKGQLYKGQAREGLEDRKHAALFLRYPDLH